MKNLVFFLFALLCLSSKLYAKHAKGGSITYAYLGVGSSSGTSKYQLTVRHYIDCNSADQIEASVFVGIFNAGTNSLIKTVTITKTTQVLMQKTTFNACINPKPTICFYLVTYTSTVELSDINAGYVLAEQECCRVEGIENISNSSNYGITNTNTIPGVINSVVYRTNSCPVFAQKDTAVICHNSYFSIDFSATDVDNDSLVYAFCPAKTGGSINDRHPNPPASPPYGDLPFASGYSYSSPLGSAVTINAKTGLISGTAPATTGAYIISVNVSEYRSGVLIGVTKKEILVTVADCSLTGATLNASYINCDGYSFTFSNESTSSNVSNYYWDFGVTGTTSDTSSQATPTYVYADTGTYVIKLKVSTSAGCTDSTTSKALVYPGFKPGFTVVGSCYESPFQFTDTTYARYGTVNSWSWDFGVTSITTDVSSLQNPTYQYPSAGTRTVTFLVGTSKGCTSTVTKSVTAYDKPDLQLAFHDTLICSIDTLQLKASGTGDFSWTPTTNMINTTSATPLVYPKDTITYIVTLKDKSCVSSDSVTVNVLDFITVTLPTDTTICQTDSIQLRPVSDALQYEWSPTTAMSNASVKYPMVAPLENTTYEVVANLGKCQDKAHTLVKVVPYPQVTVSADTSICYGTTAQLSGTMVASTYLWSPDSTLLNATSLTPIADPLQTTTYILTVQDVLGCPKPVSDSVVVTVIPPVQPFAGNDTLVVRGQPLQLTATGATYYLWTPATGLTNDAIANPIATLYDSITYVVKVSTQEGCFAYDTIHVTVFSTLPDIFVPNGFTPNDDGNNDIFRVVPVGIAQFQYLRVFNRWGQQVFATTNAANGWNGYLNGSQASPGAYVWMVRGIDYQGKVIQKKGTVMLAR